MRRLDKWLVLQFARLFYRVYGKTLRSEMHKWALYLEDDRLLHQIKMLGSRGVDVIFQRDVELLVPENIHIGNHVAIGYASILRGHGGITLGDFVVMGDQVILATDSHPQGGVYFNHAYYEPIHIQANVWIGAHVVVLPGITIGENSIIGAGAVVAKDIPPNSVALGVPATVIRQWEPDEQLIAEQKAAIQSKRSTGHDLYPPLRYPNT